MTGKSANLTSPYEHVVVLMLENRSFDNLLGYLYEDGVPAGKTFEGLQNGNFYNPIPERIKNPQHQTISPHQASDYHQPFPDPGEEYQHINTQLFDNLDPQNIGVAAIEMKPPYNLPNEVPDTAPMTGFVNDYINTLQGMGDKTFDNPDYDQYSVIMQCFKPEQIPVLSTLAKEFSVFDHWFCSVPSQTWCNRAFWHAGTSAGFVINPAGEETICEDVVDMAKWIDEMWEKSTLFTLMENKGISSKVYTDNIISLTHLINGFDDCSIAHSMESFYEDINGELPQYSFIEPKFLGQHNRHLS